MTVPPPPGPADPPPGPGAPQWGQQWGQQGGQPPPGYGPPGQPYGAQQPPGYGPPPNQPGQAGWPGQPGYGPAPGPDPTQQYGQQYGQHGPQHGGTAQLPYGSPHGGPPGGGGRSKLPWILGGVGGIIVIGAVVVLIVVLLAGRSSATPQAAAQNLVDTMNSGVSIFDDTGQLDALLCQKSRDQLTAARDQASRLGGLVGSSLDEFKKIKINAQLGKVTEISSESAKAELTLRFSNVPAPLDELFTETTETINLVKENGKWVACDLNVAE